MNKKEVREKAIRQIFEETSLKMKGFKCTKKSIYIKKEDFKLSLDFGSAISPNRIEEVNYLEVMTYVSHEGLRKYKKKKINEDNGCIGGSSIENIFKAGPPWISYDLGITEASYNEKLNRIKQVVQTDVFAFFNEFTQIEKINNHFLEPCFRLRGTIQLYLFLKEETLLNELIAKISVDRKAVFRENYIDFNRRLAAGDTWTEVKKDVNDGDDRLALEIADHFFEMGIEL